MSIPGLRFFYAWILRQAEKPYARPLLFLIAAVEAWSLIPADTLLVPMALARRDQAMRLAALASCGMMTGTLIVIGAGHLITRVYHSPEAFHHIQHGFVVFMVLMGLVRSARFFVEGWLIYKYGDPVRHFIEKHLPSIFIGAILIILTGAGFWMWMR